MKPKKIREPIIKFASLEQAKTYLREWQTRLYLDAWVFSLTLNEGTLEDANGNRIQAQISLNTINKTGAIEMSYLTTGTTDLYFKESQEVALVHELLHCKYGWLDPRDTLEGKYYDTCEHALIEEMARSLVMAKYGIGREWFVRDGL